jgi:hypothetical protein
VLENIRMGNRNIWDLNSINMEWARNAIINIWDKNAKKIPNNTTIKIKMG